MIKLKKTYTLLIVLITFFFAYSQSPILEKGNRVTINLGETPWKFIKSDPSGAQNPSFNDGSWQDVGIPHTFDDTTTFLNMSMGGNDGTIASGNAWYRKHFTLNNSYSNRKILVEFEGIHVGCQVYINGTFIPGNSAVNPQATHVLGFVGFVVDITPYVKFGSQDNVLAVRVGKSQGFYNDPGFSLVFRFGQGSGGIFRPVWMHIVDKVHIPLNVYSVLNRWGTYVATVSASEASATIRIQTNVCNDGTEPQNVTLVTKVVDANNNVVLNMESSQLIDANKSYVFDQTGTISNPKLWYPNNSNYGTPYMHKVYHIVKIGNTTVDVFVTPLGIRTITWDKNFPYFNGKQHYLWGASGRYDYPGLGTAVCEEQQWRDAKLLADIGGNIWRPGHSACSKQFVDACDNYGIMIIQPSGDHEGSFANTSPSDSRGMLKCEVHRDMIIRDRNNPSILAWEIDNGAMTSSLADALKAISVQWDHVNTRVQADRTPNPAYGDILSCTASGCEIGVKSRYPDNPAWGAEAWGRMSARFAYDKQISFVADYLQNWRKSKQANCFGFCHWYLAESPGEAGTFLELPPATYNVRSFGTSMLDFSRIPKLLYYAYQAAWVPFEKKPVVALAHHWNRSGRVRVNAFSNCPKVRLTINGIEQGIKTPNPWTGSGNNNDLSETTTQLPFQCYWDVDFSPGILKVEGLDASGNVVCFDQRITAGEPHHIKLTVEPPLVKPNGETFLIRANGSDAAFILATVVDANGNWCPLDSHDITFSVIGPGIYRGGADQYVYTGKPLSYHAPGDHELRAEGGMCKIAVKTTFTPGTVTVNATSPGLQDGNVSFTVNPVVSPQTYISHKEIIATNNLDKSKIRIYSTGRMIKYLIHGLANVSYEIFNSSGKILYKTTNLKIENEMLFINLNDIKKNATCKITGVYFIMLFIDNKFYFINPIIVF